MNLIINKHYLINFYFSQSQVTNKIIKNSLFIVLSLAAALLLPRSVFIGLKNCTYSPSSASHSSPWLIQIILHRGWCLETEQRLNRQLFQFLLFHQRLLFPLFLIIVPQIYRQLDLFWFIFPLFLQKKSKKWNIKLHKSKSGLFSTFLAGFHHTLFFVSFLHSLSLATSFLKNPKCDKNKSKVNIIMQRIVLDVIFVSSYHASAQSIKLKTFRPHFLELLLLPPVIVFTVRWT